MIELKKDELRKTWNTFTARYPNAVNTGFYGALSAGWLVNAVMIGATASTLAVVGNVALAAGWAGMAAWRAYHDHKESKRLDKYLLGDGAEYEMSGNVYFSITKIDWKIRDEQKIFDNADDSQDVLKARIQKKLDRLEQKKADIMESSATLVRTSEEVSRDIKAKTDAHVEEFMQGLEKRAAVTPPSGAKPA